VEPEANPPWPVGLDLGHRVMSLSGYTRGRQMVAGSFIHSRSDRSLPASCEKPRTRPMVRSEGPGNEVQGPEVCGGELRERDEPTGSRSLKRKRGVRLFAGMICGGAFDRGERLRARRLQGLRSTREEWGSRLRLGMLRWGTGYGKTFCLRLLYKILRTWGVVAWGLGL
jgi:hypothetical protein